MKNANLTCLSLLFLAGILPLILSAQQPVRRCATVEYNKQKEKNNPDEAEARQHANQVIRQYMNEKTSLNTRSLVTIPVVVHVLYNLNIQNISDEQVHSQIDVLNRDFGRLNSDTTLTPFAFSSLAVNTDIQFCLATQDPNGNPTTGIERRQNTSVSTWQNDDGMKSYATGGLDVWDRNRYLNIWVCALANNFLGYTQLPGGDSLYDGVVITSRAFGNTGYVSPPFHLGRTATHEIGHWLGLNHIWGDDGGACPWDPGGNDDQINDTPPQGMETTGCPTFPVFDNCSPTYPGIMFMDYMDYTDDACMNMFTQQQSDKMNAVLYTLRIGILTSDGCGTVGISNIVKGTQITVYPNPAVNELIIKNSELKIKAIEIYSSLGEKVFSQPVTSNPKQVTISVADFSPGIYFITVTDQAGNKVTKKVVKM